MDNVLIDDRRIHVDFSQSVSQLWNRYRKFGKAGGDGQREFLVTWLMYTCLLKYEAEVKIYHLDEDYSRLNFLACALC